MCNFQHLNVLFFSTRLRDPRRFAALPCPLILVEWWRVCLDEAQMVETVNRSFAKMACMLPAVHRWCVTGTPIPNGLQGKGSNKFFLVAHKKLHCIFVNFRFVWCGVFSWN